MLLGNKGKVRRTIGIKNIIGGAVRTVGQKAVSGLINHVAPAMLAHTADGIIANYSNSAEQAKEPIKGVEIANKVQRHQQSQIEKHRRSKSESGSKSFV